MGFARGGVRIGQEFAGAGVQIAGALFYGRSVHKIGADSLLGEGFEGETTVLYYPPYLPVFAQIGYRREILTTWNSSRLHLREEVSRLTFTIGLQYGLPAR
jgi:hypothetical protein